jgi:hypothetical protein
MQHLVDSSRQQPSLIKLGVLVEGLLEANRLVDAVFVSYCCMELANNKVHRAGLDVLRHMYQLNTPDADLVGMALARDMCEAGLFAQQMEDAANGTIDLHGLGAGPAKMLTLAYLEDLKVARRRYMAKRSRVSLRKGMLTQCFSIAWGDTSIALIRYRCQIHADFTD